MWRNVAWRGIGIAARITGAAHARGVASCAQQKAARSYLLAHQQNHHHAQTAHVTRHRHLMAQQARCCEK